jgi:hypothetical protein
MAVSTTIDTTLGVVSTVVQSAGSLTLTADTVTLAGSSVTLGAVKQQVTALTAGVTMSLQQAGVVTITGSAVQKTRDANSRKLPRIDVCCTFTQ